MQNQTSPPTPVFRLQNGERLLTTQEEDVPPPRPRPPAAPTVVVVGQPDQPQRPPTTAAPEAVVVGQPDQPQRPPTTAPEPVVIQPQTPPVPESVVDRPDQPQRPPTTAPDSADVDGPSADTRTSSSYASCQQSTPEAGRTVDDQTLCQICLSSLNLLPSKALLCGHTFHTDCIDAYVRGGEGTEEHPCYFNCNRNASTVDTTVDVQNSLVTAANEAAKTMSSFHDSSMSSFHDSSTMSSSMEDIW